MKRNVFEVHAGWDGDVHISYHRPVRGAGDYGLQAYALAELQVEQGADWADVLWGAEVIARAEAVDERAARAAG